ncbi:homoserine kinase [Candidatus Woesearchaeota archaeon CG10_big_fil_rev_8_21_14_0_10_44_13]|nr:MAG: homoserine kinase [Candidatus Woesearchaeota archaeon CG10_big_fil_rev_8_21_14_0_10_44_13]
MNSVKVFSPATIGNIGPGFDVLGLAVEGMGDIVQARKIKKGVKIKSVYSKWKIPKDPRKNTAGIAAKEVLKMIGAKGGVELSIIKGLPAGSGLGSSAASATAAAYAVNLIYGNKLSKNELILPATKAEEAVSGGFFADNTAPALLGGATLTRSCLPLDVVRLGTISDLIIVLVTPEIQVLTKKARAILPKMVRMKDFVGNMANSCLIASAFSKNDYSLFSRSLNDFIVEPARAKLIKGFYDVKKSAIDAGADGMTISGAGPSVFAITNKMKKAKEIEAAMLDAFRKKDVRASSIITKPSYKGTFRLKSWK